MNTNTIDFTKLKPVNYNRKSSESEDKQMLSISSQTEEATRIREFYKLPKFVKIFEEAKSAKTEFMRPGFISMMKMIENGEADSIVCWKADRLARNMTEGGKIIDLLSSGKIKAIITHDKVFYPWDNVIVLSIEFSQGKQFVKELSVNVKRGQTKKASMGLPHGVSALGFLNDKSEEKGNRKWLVDETRLKSIKILFDMFLTGTYSAGKLHRYAIEKLKLTTVKRKRTGGGLITTSRIYEILKDPVYAGFFFYGGQRYELDRNLPRLITETQHNKVKSLLAKGNIPKIKHHETTFSGFITSEKGEYVGQDVKFQVICDCKHKFAYNNKTHCPKCKIEIDKMIKPKYLSYAWYYNVKKKKAKQRYKSIAESKVKEAIYDLFVNNISFSKDIVEWSKKYIHEMKEKELNEKILINQRKEERKGEYEEKKARTRAMFRDGKFSEEDYEKDITRLNHEYSDVNETVEQIDWYSRLMEIVDITERIAMVLESDDIQAKRNIISALGSNLIWDDENLLIINKKEIQALIDGVKRNRLVISEFEPKNALATQGHFIGFDTECISLLQLVHKFRTFDWVNHEILSI